MAQEPQTQQPNQDQEISLKLKVSEVQSIVNALDEIPHKIARPLIDSLIKQAQEQLQAPAPEVLTPTAE